MLTASLTNQKLTSLVIANIRSLYVMLFCYFYLACTMFSCSQSFSNMAWYSLFSDTARDFFGHCLQLFFLQLKMITLIAFSFMSSIWFFWWWSSKVFLPWYSVLKGSDEQCHAVVGFLIVFLFFIFIYSFHDYRSKNELSYSSKYWSKCRIQNGSILDLWLYFIHIANF